MERKCKRHRTLLTSLTTYCKAPATDMLHRAPSDKSSTAWTNFRPDACPKKVPEESNKTPMQLEVRAIPAESYKTRGRGPYTELALQLAKYHTYKKSCESAIEVQLELINRIAMGRDQLTIRAHQLGRDTWVGWISLAGTSPMGEIMDLQPLKRRLDPDRNNRGVTPGHYNKPRQ